LAESEENVKIIRRKAVIRPPVVNRLGFDAKRAFNNATGLGNYSRHIIKTLTSAFGHTATYHLYTPSVKKDLGHWVQGFNLEIHRPRFLSKLRGPFWRFLLGWRLKKDKIELYHGLSNELPAGIDRKQTKTIVTIHDLIFIHYPESYKPVDRMIYKRKFRSACRRADIIIATSEHTKNDIIKYFGTDEKKIRVHYQDSPDSYHYPPEEYDIPRIMDIYKVHEPYIICVSAFQKRKNHLKLIEAYALAQPSQKLVLAGASGEMLPAIKALIAEKGLAEKVQILENVMPQHLPTLYYKAEFAVYPSLYEGFGIPLLEAMRMQLPLITNMNGCFREISGAAALYADVSNAADLAEKMKMLADDPSLREDLRKKGKEELKRFDPELLRDDLKALYKELLPKVSYI
jgi:glycosyltransferase involved in cell wall biosynthesis